MSWSESGDVDRTGAVVLDGSGAGTVRFAVQHANQKWECDSVVVTTSQAVTAEPYPQVQVYDGAFGSAAKRMGASPMGNSDVLTGRFVIDAGTDLQVNFTAGIPGVTATARITGKSYVWR